MFVDLYSLAKIVAKRMREKGFLVTPQDYIMWYDPSYKEYLKKDGDALKFDNAVEKLLGTKNYNAYDCLARLDSKLMYELNIGEKYSGGINLSVDYSS